MLRKPLKPRVSFLPLMQLLNSSTVQVLLLLLCANLIGAPSSALEHPAVENHIPMSDSTFLEIAVYTARDDQDFSPLTNRAESLLRDRIEGMHWWSHWVSLDGKVRADVVCWKDADTAYRAAGIVEKDPAFQFFNAVIDLHHHFTHYLIKTDAGELRTALNTEERLLELALFSSNQPGTTLDSQPVLHRNAVDAPGCLVYFSLQRDGEQNGFGDFALWRNAEAHHAAGAVLTTLPELQPYFGSIEELPVFQLFKLARPITP